MYCRCARPNCLVLLTQVMARARSRAWANTGKRIAARMAMMAMTTSSSMRVKPLLLCIAKLPFDGRYRWVVPGVSSNLGDGVSDRQCRAYSVQDDSSHCRFPADDLPGRNRCRVNRPASDDFSALYARLLPASGALYAPRRACALLS